MYSVVYIGADNFSAGILREIVQSGELDIVSVATYPDMPHGRGHKLHPTPVKIVALECGLPVLEIPDVTASEIHTKLTEIEAPIAILVSFKIVPVEFLQAFPKGIINLHPSYLPDLRGAAPVQWAIMLGYEKSGLSTFIISEKVDSGEILLQEHFNIGIDETAGDVFMKITHPAAKLLTRSVNGYMSGDIISRTQSSNAYHRAPRIKQKHRIIEWEWTAREIHDRIRALQPVPSALSRIGNRNVKIIRSKIEKYESKPTRNPGEIITVSDNAIIVQTGLGTIGLLQLQPEGRAAMSAEEFARGYIKMQNTSFEKYVR